MRLTRKVDGSKHIYNIKDFCLCDAIEKLGQLEDIEQELGIDLITFFKIYNSDKVHIKGKDYYWKIRHYNRHSITVGTNKTICLSFRDYGKTWALTKEELLCLK